MSRTPRRAALQRRLEALLPQTSERARAELVEVAAELEQLDRYDRARQTAEAETSLPQTSEPTRRERWREPLHNDLRFRPRKAP